MKEKTIIPLSKKARQYLERASGTKGEILYLENLGEENRRRAKYWSRKLGISIGELLSKVVEDNPLGVRAIARQLKRETRRRRRP